MGWENARKDPAYNTAEWRRARLKCLRDAGWRCQIRLTGCLGAASQADHVDQLANDPHHQNLRAACVACHKQVTAKQSGEARRAKDPPAQPRTAW